MRMNARIVMADVRKSVSTLSAATSVLVEKGSRYKMINTVARKVKESFSLIWSAPDLTVACAPPSTEG